MTAIYDKLKECSEAVRAVTSFVPETAITLGSGLGAFCDNIVAEATIPYTMLPYFPVSTVSGHDGEFVFGTLGGKRVVAMRGRVHYYEGYSPEEVVMPVRLMRMLGAEKLILTNVSGAVNPSFAVGDLIALKGHIASFMPSPLRGENAEEFGVRFPDMSEVYSSRIRSIMRETARKLGFEYKEGVYLQASGPQYETPEEVRAFGLLGADLVGMSTAIEAIAAKHAGMEICGVSCVSNMACGVGSGKLTHEEVKEAAAKSAPIFTALVTELIARI